MEISQQFGGQLHGVRLNPRNCTSDNNAIKRDFTGFSRAVTIIAIACFCQSARAQVPSGGAQLGVNAYAPAPQTEALKMDTVTVTSFRPKPFVLIVKYTGDRYRIYLHPSYESYLAGTPLLWCDEAHDGDFVLKIEGGDLENYKEPRAVETIFGNRGIWPVHLVVRSRSGAIRNVECYRDGEQQVRQR